MVSIRPSVFNQRERSDGGPFLIIEVAETEQEGVNVLFTDIPASERKSDSPGALLLNVCSDRITIYPLNVREDLDDYLQPKYGTLKRIIVTRPVIDPYILPETIDDVFELLEQLPDGFVHFWVCATRWLLAAPRQGDQDSDHPYPSLVTMSHIHLPEKAPDGA